MATVEVIAIRYQGGTVAEGFGTDMDTGRPVRFAGDWRPMVAIAEAVQAGDEPVLADVPDWAILARR